MAADVRLSATLTCDCVLARRLTHESPRSDRSRGDLRTRSSLKIEELNLQSTICNPQSKTAVIGNGHHHFSFPVLR